MQTRGFSTPLRLHTHASTNMQSCNGQRTWHKDLTYQTLVLELDVLCLSSLGARIPQIEVRSFNLQVSSKTIFCETEGTQETVRNVQVE